MAHAESSQVRDVPSGALPAFIFLTFAITWGIAGIYILFPVKAAAWFGQISGTHPLFFLATWGPGIAGFLVVLGYRGFSGIKAFASRLLRWQVSKAWVAFILIGLPLVFVAGSLIKGGSVLTPLPPGGVRSMVALLLLRLFLGPIEEFGWRGVAQPLLQRLVAPIWAGAIIGAVWGLWHVPAFYMSGTVQSGWNFLPFFAGNIVLAILVTPLFNSARGGLFWPVVFHWQLINPFWPDAQPYDTWILAAITVVVVWLNRQQMFTRQGAAINVIPAEVS